MTTFRFYGELNDFLPSAWRQRDVAYPCAATETLKHGIEALGVPHTEVELLLVNGEAAGFDGLLRESDRVAVYPHFASLPVNPCSSLREEPARFIADAHLGGLARLLRMAGFDTRYDNHFHDAEIASRAVNEARVVLTRDRELLKRREITRGCYVHAIKPAEQLREIDRRLDLARDARPFSRCLECNAPLRALDKASAMPRVPPAVRDSVERFSTCDVCGRVYWEGSHWRHMRAALSAIFSRGG